MRMKKIGCVLLLNLIVLSATIAMNDGSRSPGTQGYFQEQYYFSLDPDIRHKKYNKNYSFDVLTILNDTTFVDEYQKEEACEDLLRELINFFRLTNSEALQLLLKHWKQRNTNFEKLLNHAIEFSYSIVPIKLLLEHGANPNAMDYDGVSPLMMALSNKNIRNRKNLIYLLLSHGADPRYQDRQCKKSAISLARENGFPELANIMEIYPDIYSLKQLCEQYIQRTVVNFSDQLDQLPEELRIAFEPAKKDKPV